MDLDTYYDISVLYPGDNVDGNYMSVSYHRNRDPEKSQWTLSIDEEFYSFKISRQQNWFLDKRGWGLHPSNPFSKVGELVSGDEVVIIRYQEMSPNGHMFQDIWHGYPADIKNKKNDIPTECVLKSWLALNYIKHHQFNKIRRGIL